MLGVLSVRSEPSDSSYAHESLFGMALDRNKERCSSVLRTPGAFVQVPEESATASKTAVKNIRIIPIRQSRKGPPHGSLRVPSQSEPEEACRFLFGIISSGGDLAKR